MCVLYIFCFKQKTAYELRISDWSSDVCSSDLVCGKRRLDRIKNVTKIPLRHSNCPLALSGRSCGPALQYRRLFPDCFGPTQNLPVKADPLEPVMQPQQVGEAHAAMHLGRGASDKEAHFAGVGLGMARHHGRLSIGRASCRERVCQYV